MARFRGEQEKKPVVCTAASSAPLSFRTTFAQWLHLREMANHCGPGHLIINTNFHSYFSENKTKQLLTSEKRSASIFRFMYIYIYVCV